MPGAPAPTGKSLLECNLIARQPGPAAFNLASKRAEAVRCAGNRRRGKQPQHGRNREQGCLTNHRSREASTARHGLRSLLPRSWRLGASDVHVKIDRIRNGALPRAGRQSGAGRGSACGPGANRGCGQIGSRLSRGYGRAANRAHQRNSAARATPARASAPKRWQDSRPAPRHRAR